MQIGEDHKRGISTKLRLLDKALSEFRAWAEGRESSSALREERNNLTEQQRTKLLAETDRMMAILSAVGNELGLEPHIDVADEQIRARLATVWIHLMELNRKKLRGYGAPPEELVRYLDPQVQELLKHLGAIAEIVRFKPEREHGRKAD